MMAECPQPLTGELMASRIYSPFAYPLPRRARIVPIVTIEAERLAAAFPVVWRRGINGPELVVLRTLLENGTGYAPGTDRTLALLPLILQAYPFVLSATEPLALSDNRRMIDVAGADEPTDAGAAIAGPDGRLSRGTELRLRALEIFERDFQQTLTLGHRIEAMGLFEPWPLDFDLGGGRRCEIGELLVVSPKAFDTPRIATLLAASGIAAARLLGMHRLSLFRAGVLLAAARGARAATGPRPMVPR